MLTNDLRVRDGRNGYLEVAVLTTEDFNWRHADASVSMPCLRYLDLIRIPQEAPLGFARC
jgi:hypothetical protein